MKDEEILSLYMERDEKAVEATSEKYGSYCKAIARNILNSSEDAEECLNDTLFKAWDSIPPNRPDRLSAYLGRIAKTTALNRLRSASREKRGGGEMPLIFEELEECISGKSSVESELEAKELQKAINGFLQSLGAAHRKMFLMRYWCCFSVSEIADRSFTTENTVSVTLNRTRKKLKDYLRKRGFDI